jgi:hypothetical protein
MRTLAPALEVRLVTGRSGSVSIRDRLVIAR